jgi:YVTN family beta-propeller protein
MARCLASLALASILIAVAASGSGLAGEGAGTLVILNKSDHTASLVDRGSGEQLAVLPTGRAPHEVAVDPAGTLAVVANYGPREEPGSTLTVIDLEAGKVVRTVPLQHEDQTFHRPHGLEFLPDGERVVVTAEAEQAVLVVNVVAGRTVKVLRTGQKISHMLDLDPSGKRAFVTSIGSGTMTVLDLASGRKVADIETGEGAEGVAITPEGGQIWVTNRGADTITIIDSESLEVLDSLESPSFPIRIAFTPDGGHALVSCARSGDVAVFDTASGELVRRISMEVRAGDKSDERLFGDRFGDSPVPIGILIPPDGRHAYVANTNADIVTVIDLRRWEIVDRLRAGQEPDGMAFSPVRPSL